MAVAMTPDRAPWTCPACGCGCAPWADGCPNCQGGAVVRRLFPWLPQQPSLPSPTLPWTPPGSPTIVPNDPLWPSSPNINPWPHWTLGGSGGHFQ